VSFSWLPQPNIGVRAVNSHMTTDIPATLSGVMVVAFVGMALVAQTSRKGFKQSRVVRAVRAMAFGASFTRPTSNWVVLKSKWTGFFSVASYAHLLDDSHLLVSSLAGMDIVAITADHSPFRDGMVEVEPKLVDFTLMARTAQSQFVGFQQPFGFWCGHKNLPHQLQAIVPFLVPRPSPLVPVNLVAIDTRDIGSGVNGPVPLREAHRVGMATKTNECDLFRLEARETDDFRSVLDIFKVDFSRSMTGFTTLLVDGQLGVANIKGVR
jgi:hypothetical protein